MVSGLRLVTANEGIVVPAGIWGKLKTAFTMVTIVIAFLWASLNSDFTIEFSKGLTTITNACIDILIGISVILTVISGAVYLKAYGKYINTDR
jgi:CDP-diacylglycerol--glycerol-3-phosphate 3-phosphatidyltransferase